MGSMISFRSLCFGDICHSSSLALMYISDILAHHQRWPHPQRLPFADFDQFTVEIQYPRLLPMDQSEHYALRAQKRQTSKGRNDSKQVSRASSRIDGSGAKYAGLGYDRSPSLNRVGALTCKSCQILFLKRRRAPKPDRCMSEMKSTVCVGRWRRQLARMTKMKLLRARAYLASAAS